MNNIEEWSFPVGQPLRVEYNDPTGRFTTYKAYLGLCDGDTLQLGFEFNDLPIVNPGAHLILVFSQEAEVYYRTIVTDVYFGQGIITVSKPKRTDICAMRNYFRIDAVFPVTLDLGTRSILGQSKNISAGGILVNLENPGRLICGMRLSCLFTLPGSSTSMAVRGEIVRVDKETGGITPVAVRFTVIHEKSRKEILQYQFRCQRDGLKKDS